MQMSGVAVSGGSSDVVITHLGYKTPPPALVAAGG